MCIQRNNSDDGADNNVQHDMHHNIFGNTTIPSNIKTKIVKLIEKPIKRYEMQKRKTSKNSSKTQFDILGQFTNHFKIFLNFVTNCRENYLHSKIYKILPKTTQPAHIIAIIAILYIMSIVTPGSDVTRNNVNLSKSKFLSFVYMTSFILHVGSQFWMTFVSGLSLYFALPRKHFGQVQRVLFPRYFTINACFSLTTLVIFLKYHPYHTWDTEITIQISAMFIVFFLELFLRLYLTPPLVGLMTAKAAIEEAAGVGNEIACYNLGPLENCPHYLKMHRAFRKIHMSIAIGNILTMVCTVLHLNYITDKICF